MPILNYFLRCFLALIIFIAAFNIYASDSTGVSAPKAAYQVLTPTTTGSSSQSITYVSGSASLGPLTCPAGYAAAQVNYASAQYVSYQCTASHTESHCDSVCNGFCFGACCGGCAICNNSCKYTSTVCDAYGYIWAPSFLILPGANQSYIPNTIICKQIVNQWKTGT